MSTVVFDTHMQDQAEFWLVKLNSDQRSADDIKAFALWLAQAEQHRPCFDQVLADWQALGVVSALPFESPFELAPKVQPAEVAPLDFDPVPCDIDINNAAKPPSNVLSFPSRWPRGSGAALAASLLMAVLWLPQWQGESITSQQYHTGVGEQQTVTLADGSVITLNTNTHLTVQYSEQQRQINLRSGEAFFEVAKDKLRPFTVDSCNSEAQALGTAFNVRCESARGVVAVTEGIVQVRAKTPGQATAGLGRGYSLLPGQQSIIASEHRPKPPQAVIGANIASWRRGELVFETATLREVVDEISRYSSHNIFINSPSLAATTVTGRFQIQQAQTLLAALEGSLQMEVEVRDDGSLLLKKVSL